VLDHLWRLLDANDVARVADTLPDQRQAEARATTHVKYDITWSQTKPCNGQVPNRFEQCQFAIVDTGASSVLLEGGLAIGSPG